MIRTLYLDTHYVHETSDLESVPYGVEVTESSTSDRTGAIHELTRYFRLVRANSNVAKDASEAWYMQCVPTDPLLPAYPRLLKVAIPVDNAKFGLR